MHMPFYFLKSNSRSLVKGFQATLKSLKFLIKKVNKYPNHTTFEGIFPFKIGLLLHSAGPWTN